MRLSVDVWQEAARAAYNFPNTWQLRTLGKLFHCLHIAPYCRKYTRKFEPGVIDHAYKVGYYWRDRGPKSKWGDDPQWRDAILEVLRYVPPKSREMFENWVPGTAWMNDARARYMDVPDRRFISSDGLYFPYGDVKYNMRPDELLQTGMFVTPEPTNEAVYELAEICSYLPLENDLWATDRSSFKP